MQLLRFRWGHFQLNVGELGGVLVGGSLNHRSDHSRDSVQESVDVETRGGAAPT